MTTFEIPGPPVPKGRPRHTVTKTGHHWYTPERTVKAEEAVDVAGGQWVAHPLAPKTRAWLGVDDAE